LQQHVGRGELIDDIETAPLAQKWVNQRPTIALLSLSLDMIIYFLD